MKNIAFFFFYRYVTVGNIAVRIFFLLRNKLYKVKLINNVDMIIYSK